ncbi:aryl-alcohol oxidase-like protein [Artomyces pyxidatus]|uniref:Aryl-alcohol oxidase-like protein n=1 Tax=Artomyces pyxidatus TaxID=48021 RepID=A0ACB8SHT9_9AGAM|nr:aryl-alcohol oxidase-like protein [Artomyces pyxidatus]
MLQHLLLLAPLVHVAFARLFTDPAHLLKSEYDFVVVGAGTAGNVIASRLTEDPANSVLVIEAGATNFSNEDILAIEVPFTASNALGNASIIWNYVTQPQVAVDDRVIPYQRGRVLGGSSSINFLVYTRGSRDDFDRFARVTGDSGWSWDVIFPFILKAENLTDPVDHHNTTGQFNPVVHGHSGPVLTTLPGFPSALDPRILAVTQSNPAQFPFNLDANSGNTIGVGWTQTTAGLGQRSSSATAYLQPALNRPNLDVLINTQVTRLINIANKSAVPDLREVEFALNSTSKRFTVRASKEVVLSAGAVNTPQLLLLSGVGNSSSLSALGIHTVVNSPFVGQNLQDHPLLANQWLVNSNTTLDDISRNATLSADLLAQWEETRTGQFADGGGGLNQFAWLRLPANSSVFDGFKDPSAGPTSAHIELFPVNEFVSFSDPTPDTGSFITFVTNTVSPASRGTISLVSADPFTFPAIDPAFLTHPLDMAIAIEAVRTASAFLATPPFEGFIIEPFGALANATTDAELEAYARAGTSTFWHPCCTTKAGNSSDKTAVVEANLLLKGATGVRVVDASVFPFIPAAHLQAPVYAVAERAAHLIQLAWAGK